MNKSNSSIPTRQSSSVPLIPSIKARFSRSTGFVVSLMMAAASVSTHAAVITFGNATTISGDSDVNAALPLVSAFDIGSGADTIVNGVTFTSATGAGASAGGSYGTGEGNITLVLGGGPSGFGTFNGTAAPFTNLSASYQVLVGTTGYGNATSSFTLNQLVIGKQYQLQIWSSFSGGSGATNVTSGGNTITLNENVAGGGGGVGQFTVGTFTADATTQSVTLAPNGGAGYMLLSAVELNGLVVPEPSVTSLLMLPFIGALVASRRRRPVAA